MNDEFKKIADMASGWQKQFQNLTGNLEKLNAPVISQPPEIDFAAIERRKDELAGRYDAELVYEQLKIQVEDFQKNLADDQEIGLQLANFGLPAQIHVRSIGFKNPNMIEFYGVIDKDEVKLVQHISQLSFLLVAVSPIKNEDPYRVGF